MGGGRLPFPVPAGDPSLGARSPGRRSPAPLERGRSGRCPGIPRRRAIHSGGAGLRDRSAFGHLATSSNYCSPYPISPHSVLVRRSCAVPIASRSAQTQPAFGPPRSVRGSAVTVRRWFLASGRVFPQTGHGFADLPFENWRKSGALLRLTESSRSSPTASLPAFKFLSGFLSPCTAFCTIKPWNPRIARTERVVESITYALSMGGRCPNPTLAAPVLILVS